MIIAPRTPAGLFNPQPMTSKEIADRLHIPLDTTDLADMMHLRIQCIKRETGDGYGDVGSLYNIVKSHDFVGDMALLKGLIQSIEDTDVVELCNDICHRVEARNNAVHFLGTKGWL